MYISSEDGKCCREKSEKENRTQLGMGDVEQWMEFSWWSEKSSLTYMKDILEKMDQSEFALSLDNIKMYCQGKGKIINWTK